MRYNRVLIYSCVHSCVACICVFFWRRPGTMSSPKTRVSLQRTMTSSRRMLLGQSHAHTRTRPRTPSRLPCPLQRLPHPRPHPLPQIVWQSLPCVKDSYNVSTYAHTYMHLHLLARIHTHTHNVRVCFCARIFFDPFHPNKPT